MRWISAVLLFISLSSCSALKPVVGGRSGNVSQSADQPRYIDHISISPYSGAQPAATAKTPNTTNNTINNTFSMEANAPGNFSPMQFKYAILMDVPVEALNNLKLYSFIDEWYGAPYRFGGNTKDGIDCSAFSCQVLNNVFGATIPRMAKDQYLACAHLKRDELEEGDLVFFHTTRKGISHVGVYLGNNKFVHASLNYGVTISDLNDGYYNRSFRGGGRIRPNTTATN